MVLLPIFGTVFLVSLGKERYIFDKNIFEKK